MLAEPLTAARTTDRFAAATLAFLGQRGDTGALLAAALAEDPDHIAAHCLAGFAQFLAARRPLIAAAGSSLAAARATATSRAPTRTETALIAALSAWHDDGDMPRCAALLDAALARTPCDALVLRLSHAVHFMLGDAAAMRRAVTAALPAWDPSMPAYPYILGCHAFALGETGELALAERTGRLAVAMQPRDLWGIHAVTHAMGGLGRPRDGIDWIIRREPHLTDPGSFVRHIHWHRALCHLRLGAPDAALDLYDRLVFPTTSQEVRDILNAASLLWRIEAAGLPAGAARWNTLADIAATRVGDHAWAFADLHYVLCLAAAGRADALAAMLAGIAARANAEEDTQARVYADVGLTAARGIASLLGGAPAEAADLFAQAAPGLPRVGGSNAQRDLLRQMRRQAECRAAHP